MKLLTVIVLLPLAGFLLNGLLGRRLGRTFVSVVGCGLPLLRGAGLRLELKALRNPQACSLHALPVTG